MGRSASHITLECAFATHPNLALIGEEKKGLKAIVQEIADLVCKRKEAGKEYGVILIPEGLIEFIPEMKALIEELNQLLIDKPSEKIRSSLSQENQALFSHLPEKMQEQLLFDRDPHGNVALSQIETEHLLIELVKKELDARVSYKGKFSPVSHFFGYEGRSCFPSNFDANYCYALGRLAAIAVRDRATGMICSVQNLEESVDKWEFTLVPIVRLMHMEKRKGKDKPVIQKALVDLQGAPFSRFAKMRKSWELEDLYCFPGPIQFFGESGLTDSVPCILSI
jgi:pyrophosphate--fructose-6-phosphate 1-phosphotransferase